jgi:hypothetical protein
MFPILDLFNPSGEKDPSTLATGFRFDNISLRKTLLLIQILGLKLSVLIGQEPGFGKKIVLLHKFLLHFHEVLGQIVLASQVVHARKVIYLLVGLQLCKKLRRHCIVSPV